MNADVFEIYEGGDGWRWRRRAANHKIVADGGEAYATPGNARRAISRLVRSIEDGNIDVVTLARDD